MKFDCLSYMNWRETLYLLFYEKGKRVKEEGLGPVELADRLSKLSFFNRFSKNLLVLLALSRNPCSKNPLTNLSRKTPSSLPLKAKV